MIASGREPDDFPDPADAENAENMVPAERLRQAEQARRRLELEIERAAEGWKIERRRLTAEIEGLRRKVESARVQIQQIDSLKSRLDEARRSNRQLEDRWQEQALEHETQRRRLEARIADLEREVVDQLYRSGNAGRTPNRPVEAEPAADPTPVPSLPEEAPNALEAERARLRQLEIEWACRRRALEDEIANLRRALASRPPSFVSVIFSRWRKP